MKPGEAGTGIAKRQNPNPKLKTLNRISAFIAHPLPPTAPTFNHLVYATLLSFN